MLTLVISVILIGCKKDFMADNHTSLSDYISTTLYLGVDIVESSEYGTFLSFESEKAFKHIHDTLSEFSISSRNEWEKNLGFVSLRQTQLQDSEKETFEPTAHFNFYPNEAFASILNPQGYVMVAGILYQDTQNGNLVYKIDKNGKRTIHYQQDDENNAARSSCNWGDNSSYRSAHPCFPGGMNTYRIDGKINHWLNWVTFYEYLYIESFHRIGNCQTGGWSNASGTLSFSGSFDLTINGSAVTGTINVSYANKYSVSHLIAQGQDICMNSVSVTHTGVYNGTGKGANTSTSF